MKTASHAGDRAAALPHHSNGARAPLFGSHSFSKIGSVLLGAIALTGAALNAHAEYAVQTLATGLNNPRGLALAADGSLYITEAGSPIVPGPSTPSITTGQGTLYYNTTGSIARYANGSLGTVLSGLPSLFNSTSGEVSGAHGIGLWGDDLYYTVGLGADPAARSTSSEFAGFGQLMLLPSGGSTPQAFADISAFEGLNNPAGGPVDSNPFQILPTANGIFVADAGGNSILNVSSTGTVSLVATLPTAPAGAEPVPTGVATDSFGNLYVSQLTGFPFPVGGSSLYRIDGSMPTPIATGFTNVIDLAAGPNGHLYLLEFAQHGLLSGDPSGALWEVDPVTGEKTLIIDQGLTTPSAIAVGADGTIFVANQGAIPGQGELLAYRPVPEPATYGLLGAAALLGLAWVRRRARRAAG
ncbi:MAG TPA: ScyD/ScyE family protein [Opitutaceae bacterium]|nr:ScyD/ScyE family protein [Opitutaceae bacterium]